jgi:23S rRNA pseudouridine1911/1915/1917 synthase
MTSPIILHEDEAIVVIDKPAGLMVHPDGRSKGETLIDWIREKYPDMEGVGEPLTIVKSDEEDVDEDAAPNLIERPGIVHRLDRDTSGALVLTRTKEAHRILKGQFMDRHVRKTYRAFVYGSLNEERGIIDRAIGKSRTDFRQWSAGRGTRGTERPARTDYRTILRSKEASYAEVFPHTGRTHQIRVHFKAIQHPVICDELYGNGRPPLLGFARLALHALSLSFKHPVGGKEMLFTAPLPPDFVHAEKELRALADA